MQTGRVWTRALAIAGAVLVWLDLLAPLVLGVVSLVAWQRFRLDYLMPAELFLLGLAGGLLLLWAACRACLLRREVAWSLGIAVVALVASQAIAVVTGLASGARAAEGWPWMLVLGVYAVFLLALMALAITGIRLCRRLRTSGSLAVS